jgi:hypothetical protein
VRGVTHAVRKNGRVLGRRPVACYDSYIAIVLGQLCFCVRATGSSACALVSVPELDEETKQAAMQTRCACEQRSE